ncbi:PLP-dependent aminotransferase family protein [Parendozoicomonas sp. Alg238-R29]|uniref:aminotransferase-like domain-containing protein n=1 Tax=Parendozoicomonas sp. Alg238-R29 TaxID=2993446 RepID=UPI00248DA197|nr:PLP-dependent aminotransferase family protein [Parendozoicomonas sp. Alg238-R29]
MSTPKYLEIASTINTMIDSGEYPKGSKLPPHRSLANDLGTTPATVAKAYNFLSEQGRIESFIGRGSFVSHDKALDQVIYSEAANKEINFSILQPCFDAEHLQLLDSHIQTACHSPDKVLLHSYAESSGIWQHREAGLEWSEHFGLEAKSADEILLANGAQHALSGLIQLYTKPGDLIAVEAQTYPGILSILNFLGRRVVGISMDDKGMIPKALNETCIGDCPKMVIIVPSHQNPTGISMPKTRREEIANVIEKHSIWLLEDDIYGFLNQDVISPLTNLVPHLGFYVSSLSKAISPGLRSAYIKAPKAEARHLANFIRASIWLAPPLVFAAASSLIKSGDAFRLATRQRNIANKRQSIAQELLPSSGAFKNTGSYHIWLTLPDDWSSEEFALAAKEHKLLVSSASYFNATAEPLNAIRLSVMSESNEKRYKHGLKELSLLLEQKQYKHIHF